jgi:pimeloyl-ACP methyl ester carboxylesterase
MTSFHKRRERMIGVVLVSLLLLLGGLLEQVVWMPREELNQNKCEMTYMWPTYAPIARVTGRETAHQTGANRSGEEGLLQEVLSLMSSATFFGEGNTTFSPSLARRVPAHKYTLLAYFEGRENHAAYVSASSRGGKGGKAARKWVSSKLTGVPVLFLPGNGGSPYQVRSIAAEAHRIFHGIREVVDSEEDPSRVRSTTQRAHTTSGTASRSYKRHLDFFTLDFEDELSGVSGDLLLRQARAVNEALALILKLYQPPSRGGDGHTPSTVMIVGHSMGGVVARCALALQSGPPSIRTIVTLNSPHAGPPALPDSGMGRAYEVAESLFVPKKPGKSGDLVPTPLSEELVLVSIAGGFRDTLVRSDLADVESVVPRSNGVTVLTTSLPRGAAVSADHQCIAWCNQVVVSVAQLLLGMVSSETAQDTLSRVDRLEHVSSHFALGKANHALGLDDVVVHHGAPTKLRPRRASDSSKLFSSGRGSAVLDLASCRAAGGSGAAAFGWDSGEVRAILKFESSQYSQPLADMQHVKAGFFQTSFQLEGEHAQELRVNGTAGADVHVVCIPDSALSFPSAMPWEVATRRVTGAAHLVLQNQVEFVPSQWSLSHETCIDNDTPKFHPRVIQYTPSMDEFIQPERAEDFVVRFHHAQRRGQRAEDVHFFVLTDPKCTYVATVSPSWLAMIGMTLRSYIGLVPGLMFVSLFAMVALEPSGTSGTTTAGSVPLGFRFSWGVLATLPLGALIDVLSFFVGQPVLPRFPERPLRTQHFSEGSPSWGALSMVLVVAWGLILVMQMLKQGVRAIIRRVLPASLAWFILALVPLSVLWVHPSLLLLLSLIVSLRFQPDSRKTEVITAIAALVGLAGLPGVLVWGQDVLWILSPPGRVHDEVAIFHDAEAFVPQLDLLTTPSMLHVSLSVLFLGCCRASVPLIPQSTSRLAWAAGAACMVWFGMFSPPIGVQLGTLLAAVEIMSSNS